MTGKVVARIMGGLGNQLFCYAAARRLALVSDAELVVDDETGFVRDFRYRRTYELDAFRLPARKATDGEKFKPLGRLRRKLLRLVSHRMAFDRRPYVDEVAGRDFDARLLALRPRGTIWLDGYWQSEGYFADVADTIRDDLTMAYPADERNAALVEKMAMTDAVALHVRWFDEPGEADGMNVASDYYHRAVAAMIDRVPKAHFFVFSDRPDAARARLAIGERRATFVSHNDVRSGAVEDFRLMRKCRHFITANSTFSWWAAWLGECRDSVVIAPSPTTVAVPSWTFKGLLPDRWTVL